MPHFWSGFRSPDIAVDLGTSKIGIFVKGEGTVAIQPPAITWRKERSGSKVVIGIGDRANAVLGKEPQGVETIWPMRGGVIEQLEAIKVFLGELQRGAKIRRGLVKPSLLIGAPIAISNIERRAIYDALSSFNAKAIHIVEEPIAAAIGSGIDISESIGNMLVDIGYGITEVAIISLGGIVNCASRRIGGADIDQALQAHLRRRHNLLVGEQTIARIHADLCHLNQDHQEDLIIKGKNAQTMLPDACVVSMAEIMEAVALPVNNILNVIKSAFETIPAMLAADLVDRGVVLSGGTALLPGLAQHLEAAIGVSIRLSEQPRDAVLHGLGHMLSEVKTLDALMSHADRH